MILQNGMDGLLIKKTAGRIFLPAAFLMNAERCRLSAQENLDQFLGQRGIRLVPKRQVHPGLFVHNALVMGEGIKAHFSVVGAHAAGAYAAKAHLGGCQVNHGVVDAAAAKGTLGGRSWRGPGKRDTAPAGEDAR